MSMDAPMRSHGGVGKDRRIIRFKGFVIIMLFRCRPSLHDLRW